jgi:zinc transport system substrate-binding protein
MTTRPGTLLALSACGILLAACGRAPVESAPAPLPTEGLITVAAVNYPLAYLAERIGGEQMHPIPSLPAGIDPAYWEPRPEDVVRIQSAEVILLNGAGYASWLRTATLPASRTVDTSAGFTDRLIPLEHEVTHGHGPSGEHTHGGTAFTTWLDPELAGLHAEAIRDRLAARRPERVALFDERLAAVRADLEALDARLAAAVAQDPDRPVLFSHPVYQYLERRYDIAGTSLHLEPDQAPTDAQWSEVEAIARETGARWMIWEGMPLSATVDGLRERGILSIVFDPCGNAPETGDLLSAMAANAEGLEAVYGAEH